MQENTVRLACGQTGYGCRQPVLLLSAGATSGCRPSSPWGNCIVQHGWSARTLSAIELLLLLHSFTDNPTHQSSSAHQLNHCPQRLLPSKSM
ncbi:hypothetical protein PCASD_25350 [Puccinia coronata f. sp. avenae]|uniref:Uncharacterized protein n=1 Tax=Puccinia coronata f. sp. avenae TaxID=200324 RepID=A0A2N5S0S2_9BASI|nr:hypothetical protein PCASD_25350 [Puccinia coronata f. sp. avenae]